MVNPWERCSCLDVVKILKYQRRVLELGKGELKSNPSNTYNYNRFAKKRGLEDESFFIEGPNYENRKFCEDLRKDSSSKGKHKRNMIQTHGFKAQKGERCI